MPIEPYLRTEKLLGFECQPGNIDAYIQHIQSHIDSSKNTTILAHNLHSLYLFYRSASLRDCYRNSIAMVDGMPIIWFLKLAGRSVSTEDRLTYVDFIWPLLEHANNQGWQVCHIGQASDVQQRAISKIKHRLPDIQLHAIPGYFDHSYNSSEGQAIIQKVNQSGTQLLLVGLGSPLQEHWITQHREQLQVPAVLSCGACMEYVAGSVGTPPRWMGKLGLEWSYRLLENPRRFASRYLTEPWALLFSMLRYRISGHR